MRVPTTNISSTAALQNSVARSESFPAFHVAAGIILMLYGLSHLGFLMILDRQHSYANIVLPLFTDWNLYLFVGVMEIVVGVLCIIIRGSSLVNIIILTFVALLLWYRWAFSYAGGTDCGCLGLFGQLFHLHKQIANELPLVTLVLLTFFGVFPWLHVLISSLFRRAGKCAAIIFVFVLTQQVVISSQVIEVSGLVDWQDYNWETGAAIKDYQEHNTFVALLSGNDWIISVTNIDRPQWWAQAIHVGSDNYIIQPNSKYGILDKGEDHLPEASSQQVLLDGSGQFLRADDDIGMVIGWFTYGFSKASIRTNGLGLIDMPLPTGNVRNNPRAFGYRWLIELTDDERFVKMCSVVRDKQLDLSDSDEFLRPELDYPDNLTEFNDYKQLLFVRRKTPDGFVKCQYQTLRWESAGDMTVPTESKLIVYWWDVRNGIGPKPWHVETLKASHVAIRDDLLGLLPNVLMTTTVKDYRYKRSNTARIFKYAEYTLNPGEAWKPATDPALLAEAEQFLKHGHKYTHLENRTRLWVIWSILIVAFLPIAIGISKLHKHKHKNKT